MKKLTLALLTLVGFASKSYSDASWDAVKNLKIDLVQHTKECKAEWLDHKKDGLDAKFDLLTKQHNEEADLKLAELKSMPDTLDKEVLKAHCLRAIRACLALKEKHMGEWKDLHAAMKDSTTALMQKDATALADFKQKLDALGTSSTAPTNKTTGGGVEAIVVEPELAAITVGAPAETVTEVLDLK
jgi:hypothetical protein